MREPLRKVNESIQEVLSRITIWDMKEDSGNGKKNGSEAVKVEELVSLS